MKICICDHCGERIMGAVQTIVVNHIDGISGENHNLLRYDLHVDCMKELENKIKELAAAGGTE